MSILNTELKKDNKGNIIAQKSNYQPAIEVQDRLSMIGNDFSTGNEIMNKTYREFNDLSLINRQSIDQRTYNAWQEPLSDNPDDAWKSNAVRPITRNKIISIAAHVTGSLIFPRLFAQNENDDEDKDAAIVMRDLMEWRAEQADYSKTFVYSIISALVNPAVIVHTEFSEVFRTVKEPNDKGGFDKETILDDLFSGYQDIIVPVDELYIENIYEHNIQKQGFLIWRKFPSFDSAQAKYGDNENFKKYVRPGVQIMFSDDDSTFYEAYDKDLEGRLVEELIYYNRSLDLQIVVVNGVMITDVDQPNPRKDKKYPFGKTGYELFDEGKFFYYRSLANKTSVDDDVVNILYRMIIDGTFLQLMPPTATFGEEEIDASVIAPGMNTAFESADSKIQKIDVGGDLTAGYNALNKVESSISESSADPLQSGQALKGQQTAFEISRLEQNARTMLGLFGHMIGFLVKDLGELFVSDILQFMTVGDVMQVTSPASRIKFRNFIIPDRIVEGKKITRKIMFDMDLPEDQTADERLEGSFDLMEEEGGFDSDNHIMKVNPTLFRDIKFKVKVSPDVVTPPSDNVKKALNLEEYDRAIANPLVDQEAITRDLLLGSYEQTKEDTDKYIKKEAPVAPAQPAKAPGLADMAAKAEQVGVPK